MDKGKMKRVWIGVGALCLAAVILLAFSFSRVTVWSFPKYSYVNTSVKGFHSADQAINLDGKLDDGAWQGKRWLKSSMKTDESVTLAMTSYFGADGIYMAFDIRDTAVYYSSTRTTSNNSGVEFYISSLDGANGIEGKAYEIDVTAAGTTNLRKYVNGTYKTWPADIHAAVVTDGEINSGSCFGYTIELYLPYKLLGDDCTSFYAMPALIRTVSAEDTKRQWYNFGAEELGSSWTKAATWWTFDTDGLVAYDAEITVGKNGSIDGRDFAVGNSDYTFKVIPESGFYASYVYVNGKNVASKLSYENGTAYYTVYDVSGDISVEAAFAKLPDETVDINGRITNGSEPVEGALVYAVKNGWALSVPLHSDGSYSASLPCINGVELIVTAEGYVPERKSIVSGRNDIVLNRMYLGSNANVSHREFVSTDWDFSRLYENCVRLKSKGFSRTVMNSGIYSDIIFVSANVTLPIRSGIDSRAGFIFCDSKSNDAFVCLTMENEKGQDRYSVQIISKDGGSWKWKGQIADISKDEAIREAANSEAGVNLSVLYQNGTFDIWVNGSPVASKAYPCDENGENLFQSSQKAAVGLQGWNNKTVFHNLLFRSSGPTAEDKGLIGGFDALLQSQGAGKLTGETIAVAGSSYTFHVVPDTGYYASKITVNGQDVTELLRYENKKAYYTVQDVTCDLNISAAFKPVPTSSLTLSGTVTDGCEKITGAKGYFAAGGCVRTFAIRQDGSYLARIPDIKGSIYTEADGYVTSVNPISRAKDGVLNIIMVKSYLGENGSVNHKTFKPEQWDLSLLSDGVAQCLSSEFGVTVMNSNLYSDHIYASANISLPKAEGKDTRAGFVFYDRDGNDVFICLTMSNEAGQYEYSVQVISGGGKVWRNSGGITWINNYSEITSAAGSENGVPFAVQYTGGKFNIWIDGNRVGSGVYPKTEDGSNPFQSSPKLAVGLQSWNYASTFSHLVFKDNAETIPEWDLSDLKSGTALCRSYAYRAQAVMENSYSESVFVSANIRLPKVKDIDTRAGFVFEEPSGNDVFVALGMNNERGQYVYNVQIVSRQGKLWEFTGNISPIAGWKTAVDAANGEGVPFAVYYQNGTFSVWVDNKIVADHIYASENGGNIFSKNTAVKVGMQCWNYPASFKKIDLSDTCPSSMSWEPYNDYWDLSALSEGTAKCLVTANVQTALMDGYFSRAKVSANITLPRMEGTDTRAGFRFTDENGKYVFVALTMNNERGQYTYDIQLIGGGKSWSYSGKITKIAGMSEIAKAAGSGTGVPFAVLYENGTFDIWIGGLKVAENIYSVSGGANIFSSNAKVKLGLESWNNQTVFTDITTDTSR